MILCHTRLQIGYGATKDDMRFYVRYMFTRLKIGVVGIKLQALIGLYEVVTDDEKYFKIVVLEFEDLYGLLVNFLDYSELEMAIVELNWLVLFVSSRNLAGVEEIKRFMVEEGVVTVFLNVAKSKDEVLMINATEFLQAMAYGD
ncbi:hypothetical protein RJ641_023180 [Dillenia turbinata]|uniref:Uncharacterized protein n=1 Tax=Dillenia turbinata TaxID=194707 RepID=A0AAN8UIY2_9MAGN